jgi:nicotinate-nucleotide--dimethylbenzimidazole phosphoribosyltransferase
VIGREDGVSAYPKEVTRAMVASLARGVAAVSVLARSHGVPVSVVDVGVDGEIVEDDAVLGVTLRTDRVRRGSRNLRVEAAMTPEESTRAIEIGADEARRLVASGATILAVGEVGIGNTTAAAALVAALTGLPSEVVVGRGTGVDDAGLAKKIRVVAEAVARVPPRAEALDVLGQVGGHELAAMVGFVLAAAEARCLVVLDGFLAQAAALVAVRHCPEVGEVLVASHRSAERGSTRVLEELGLEPVLDLRMRLGEGTGAVLAASLVRDAVRLEREMGTLAMVGLP